MKNIVLVGMMGSGKTTIGMILLDILSQMKFVDTDVEIEKEQRISINKIFEKYGEACFRNLEEKMIKKYSMKSSYIISTGGGVCENIKNIENLQERGVLFYLKTSPNVLYERLKDDDTRPKLKGDDMLEKIVSLSKKREKNYNLADFVIETDNKLPENVAKEIIEKYEQF